MTAAVRAGLVYVAIVFGLSFVLGTRRVLVAEPRLGSVGAVDAGGVLDRLRLRPAPPARRAANGPASRHGRSRRSRC
jgi:hypothetical protein